MSVPIWFTFTRIALAASSRAALEPLLVRHEDVVADELHPRPELGGQVRPALPVVLGEPSSIDTIGNRSSRSAQNATMSSVVRSAPSRW